LKNFGSGDVLAGVHSFIASVDGLTDADYGDISGSTRVSSYASWITTTLMENDPAAPELASWIIWMVFAAGLFWNSQSRGALTKCGLPKMAVPSPMVKKHRLPAEAASGEEVEF
jgi:hypothetical protein